MTNHARLRRLCPELSISQAATDDPHIDYHHRGNAEYNQVFHLLSHCLTDGDTGVDAPGAMSRFTHPGQGCPQRSQLQPTCASASRAGNSSNATSFNINLVVSASSVNKRVGFIESLPTASKTTAIASAMTGRFLAFALQKLRSPVSDDTVIVSLSAL